MPLRFRELGLLRRGRAGSTTVGGVIDSVFASATTSSSRHGSTRTKATTTAGELRGRNNRNSKPPARDGEEREGGGICLGTDAPEAGVTSDVQSLRSSSAELDLDSREAVASAQRSFRNQLVSLREKVSRVSCCRKDPSLYINEDVCPVCT